MNSRLTTAQTNGSERPASDPHAVIENGVLEQLLPASWREMVGPDPHRPGEDRWRLLGPSISIWAIISYLKAVEPEFTMQSIHQTADDYQISEADVLAAIAYYREHREAIDARLKVNEMAVS